MITFYWMVEYIACVVEVFGLFCFGDVFMPTQINIKKRCIAITLLPLFIIFLNNIKLISIVSTLLIMLIFWLTLLIIERKKPLLSLFVIFFYTSVIISIDFILYSILNLTMNIDFFEFSNTFSLYRVGTIIATKTILIILCIFMYRISDKEQLKGKKFNIIIMLLSVIMIIISTIMYFVQLKQDEHFSQLFILAFFIVMLLMIIAIYCSLIFIVKKERFERDYLLIEQQNILLQKSLQEQEKTFDLWRKSLHDYKHKLLALESMVKCDRYDEVLESIEDELKIFRDKAFYLNTGNSTVDIILNSKMNIAQHQGIIFTVNAKITEKPDISDMDLSIILGNLIDNAITAVSNQNIKNIHIQISQIKGMLIIKIINSFEGDKIILETQKKNKFLHGIGLKSINHIVDKYNGSFSLELKNNYVIALVTI